MRKRKTFLPILCLLTIFAGSPIANCAEKIVCAYYDISDDTSTNLTVERRKHILEQLRNSEASIIVLAGLRDQPMLDSILKEFNGVQFSKLLKSVESATCIAMISKIKPLKFEALTEQKYKITKETEILVERGFIHAVFDINGYIFHIFGAHLKDKSKHPLYNQYNMRRYEARRLRALITETIKGDKKHPANIILLAGLNESCGKAPVKDIYNRRFGIPKRLFDLRPVDSINVSWTTLNETLDEYERIDYIIISSGIIPEVILDETMIIENPNWQQASIHRPLIVTIMPEEKPLWSKNQLDVVFPKTIRSYQLNLGQKRKRGSEVSEQ